MMGRYGVPILTKRQQQVLDGIIELLDEHSRPPTIRELGDKVGIASTNGVNDHLKALERKGYLERGGHLARALVVLRDVDGKPMVSREDEVSALRARIAELEAQLAEVTRATRAA